MLATSGVVWNIGSGVGTAIAAVSWEGFRYAAIEEDYDKYNASIYRMYEFLAESLFLNDETEFAFDFIAGMLTLRHIQSEACYFPI